jgi:transketolase
VGDGSGERVTGKLFWLPYPELERIRRAAGDQQRRVELFASACRLNALYMIARAGSGHIGSSFSSLDIVAYLQLEELERNGAHEDLYFSSKGHDAPGLYAVLLGLGKLPFAQLHQLRQLGGLPGHPDIGTPGIVTNTGSLGMGISKAKGMALARRMHGDRGRIYVLTGDGELQEGQIWESLISAVRLGLHEITVIVDHNKLQSDSFVEATSPLGDLEAKFRSFGAHVERVDGHDVRALAAAVARCKSIGDRPQVIIADTIKGRGVSFMEHTALDSDVALYRFHSGAPDANAYTRAAYELMDDLQGRAAALGLSRLAFEATERTAAPAPAPTERLISAYAEALVNEMELDPRLVALDADLCVDTGQLPARTRFPERHLECGIAEMDMVSLAGGLALEGLLPVCHSFACFLSARANEQIYNNATERTRVVYVMSLAGLLPAGPGHSHQAVRDIAALAAVPGLTLIAPSCAAEVSLALQWCTRRAPGSSVLRLESMPCAVPYTLPEGYTLEEGVGRVLRPGADGLFVGYGPLLLSEAHRAIDLLRERHGLSIGLVNLPWLNRVDAHFLGHILASTPHLFALDNHYVEAGQGTMLGAALARAGSSSTRLTQMGVEGIPACGAPGEVLAHHRLDAQSLAERVREVIAG